MAIWSTLFYLIPQESNHLPDPHLHLLIPSLRSCNITYVVTAHLRCEIANWRWSTNASWSRAHRYFNARTLKRGKLYQATDVLCKTGNRLSRWMNLSERWMKKFVLLPKNLPHGGECGVCGNGMLFSAEKERGIQQTWSLTIVLNGLYSSC